jgi:hypothetical protein
MPTDLAGYVPPVGVDARSAEGLVGETIREDACGACPKMAKDNASAKCNSRAILIGVALR